MVKKLREIGKKKVEKKLRIRTQVLRAIITYQAIAEEAPNWSNVAIFDWISLRIFFEFLEKLN